MQNQFNTTINKSYDFYLLPTAVITDHFWVIFTEGGIKISFPKVGQKLDSPAVHHVLTVVNHAVQVVEVGLPRVAVPIFPHWNAINSVIFVLSAPLRF